jgi:hypothetical protein
MLLQLPLLTSSTPVPTMDSVLGDRVFEHVMEDVRALPRNDLKLQCLTAVYCEEFCSCEQLKQVRDAAASAAAAAAFMLLLMMMMMGDADSSVDTPLA